MKILDERASGSHRTRSPALFAIGALVLLALGVGGWWFTRRPAPAAEERPRPEPERALRAQAATGSIRVSANLPDAVVFVDGRKLGPAPQSAAELSGGAHRVWVEKAGYLAYEREVHVVPGREVAVEASLREAPPLLRVESDVPGASVFVDREYVGTTPLETSALAPGPHRLNVSLEGFEMQTRTIELVPGANEVRVSFRERAPLAAAVAVKHKHGFGSCSGRLVAEGERLRYETEHKDAFDAPLSALVRFEIDYLDKNLKLEAGGRTYNFEGDPDALFVFHKEVAAAR